MTIVSFDVDIIAWIGQKLLRPLKHKTCNLGVIIRSGAPTGGGWGARPPWKLNNCRKGQKTTSPIDIQMSKGSFSTSKSTLLLLLKRWWTEFLTFPYWPIFPYFMTTMIQFRHIWMTNGCQIQNQHTKLPLGAQKPVNDMTSSKVIDLWWPRLT